MRKRAQKRQKTRETPEEKIQPLGTEIAALVHDDASKDDEERRLESMLFGTTYVPRKGGDQNILVVSDEEEDAGLAGERELQGLLDTDLFFVDDSTGNPLAGGLLPEPDIEGPRNSDGGSEGETGEPDIEGDESSGDEKDTGLPVASSSSTQAGRKVPAWLDPDDANLEVSLAKNKRFRKLRDTVSEDTVGGKEYERRLRRQYEKINPTPEWAVKARTQLRPSKHKRRRSSLTSEEEDTRSIQEDLPEILASTGGILGQKSRALPQGNLAIERLRDANISARAEGAIKAVQFHPSTQVPVLLTASEDRRLRLFNVDGHTNPHLQTVHVPSLPITKAIFHPTGSSILLTGPRPFFYTYDLQTGATTRSPRGLWGTTFSGAKVNDASMEICAFDPNGEVLAVAGRRGYVHLVDWRSGAGQVVGSVKMNSPVKSVWWTSGQQDGIRLMGLGEDAEVYVWDVGQRRCMSRWKDEGGYGSQVITGDPSGRYLGIGSRHGFVNVYDSAGAINQESPRPKFLKSIKNLTTSITSVRFNNDSQLLAIASNSKKRSNAYDTSTISHGLLQLADFWDTSWSCHQHRLLDAKRIHRSWKQPRASTVVSSERFCATIVDQHLCDLRNDSRLYGFPAFMSLLEALLGMYIGVTW